MSPRSRKEYLEAMYIRYKKASRIEKAGILDEFCATCGYHRKHAIRLLRTFKRFQKPKHKKKGTPSIYLKESILKPLKCIWHAANLPCSKRLKAILPLWLPSYQTHYGQLSDEESQLLLRISSATIDRLFKPIRARYKGHGRSM